MKNCFREFWLLGALAVLASIGGTGPVYAEDAPPAAQKIYEKLLGAIQAGDREAFVADGTDAVKQGTTKQVIDLLAKQVGSRLKKGYDAEYLCQLKQAGHEVYLWKLKFKDEGDDVVARIAVKDGKVAGFYLQ